MEADRPSTFSPADGAPNHERHPLERRARPVAKDIILATEGGGTNRSPTVGLDAWRLPQHAHVIVGGTDRGSELLTIYGCGAAREPLSAQVTGNLVRVRVDHETVRQPTGYIAKLREPGVLERRDDTHWVISEPDA